jgi:hypothetical protein
VGLPILAVGSLATDRWLYEHFPVLPVPVLFAVLVVVGLIIYRLFSLKK